MLSEVYQKASNNRICQVELAETYEHKHQMIGKEKPNEGLLRMAGDIASALFQVLTQDGIVLSEAFFRTMLTTYMQEARISIEKYHALSLINGLIYDRHSEIEAIEFFVGSIRKAIADFVKDPVVAPMLAAWVRITAAIPDFEDRISETVDLDNA
jgi:glucosyl-3-phosphoglycerate synthase